MNLLLYGILSSALLAATAKYLHLTSAPSDLLRRI